MGHEKAIASGKEHRKPYRRSRRFDRTCRNHGSCNWCRSNRTYFDRRWRLPIDVDEICTGGIDENNS